MKVLLTRVQTLINAILSGKGGDLDLTDGELHGSLIHHESGEKWDAQACPGSREQLVESTDEAAQMSASTHGGQKQSQTP